MATSYNTTEEETKFQVTELEPIRFLNNVILELKKFYTNLDKKIEFGFFNEKEATTQGIFIKPFTMSGLDQQQSNLVVLTIVTINNERDIANALSKTFQLLTIAVNGISHTRSRFAFTYETSVTISSYQRSTLSVTIKRVL